MSNNVAHCTNIADNAVEGWLVKVVGCKSPSSRS